MIDPLTRKVALKQAYNICRAFGFSTIKYLGHTLTVFSDGEVALSSNKANSVSFKYFCDVNSDAIKERAWFVSYGGAT